MTVVTLIVMEPGAGWPGHVGDSENVVAVANAEEGLLEKTRRKLESMRQQDQHVRVAMLACNQEAGDSSVSLRAELADELLRAVASVACGRVVLTAPEYASMRHRCELLSLAGDLSHRLRGTTTTVSVRFGEGDRRELGPADGIGGEVLKHALRYYGSAQAS